jgi:hypothetical protein
VLTALGGLRRACHPPPKCRHRSSPHSFLLSYKLKTRKIRERLLGTATD